MLFGTGGLVQMFVFLLILFRCFVLGILFALEDQPLSSIVLEYFRLFAFSSFLLFSFIYYVVSLFFFWLLGLFFFSGPPSASGRSPLPRGPAPGYPAAEAEAASGGPSGPCSESRRPSSPGPAP